MRYQRLGACPTDAGLALVSRNCFSKDVVACKNRDLCLVVSSDLMRGLVARCALALY